MINTLWITDSYSLEITDCLHMRDNNCLDMYMSHVVMQSLKEPYEIILLQPSITRSAGRCAYCVIKYLYKIAHVCKTV